jgi:hypothetical protein
MNAQESADAISEAINCLVGLRDGVAASSTCIRTVAALREALTSIKEQEVKTTFVVTDSLAADVENLLGALEDAGPNHRAVDISPMARRILEHLGLAPSA